MKVDTGLAELARQMGKWPHFGVFDEPRVAARTRKCWRCGNWVAVNDNKSSICNCCGASEFRPIQPEDWVGAA